MGSHRARAQAPTLQLEEKVLGPLPKARTGSTITTEQAGRRPHQAPDMGPSWLHSAVQPPGGLLLPLGLQSSLLPSPPNKSTHPLSCPWCKEF